MPAVEPVKSQRSSGAVAPYESRNWFDVPDACRSFALECFQHAGVTYAMTRLVMGAAISVAVLSFNVFGDALRDAGDGVVRRRFPRLQLAQPDLQRNAPSHRR